MPEAVAMVKGRGPAGLGRGEPLLSTMYAFNGLERQAVVAIDIDEMVQAQWPMPHYPGSSKARVLLHVSCPSRRKAVMEGKAAQSEAR